MIEFIDRYFGDEMTNVKSELSGVTRSKFEYRWFGARFGFCCKQPVSRDEARS